MNHTGNVYRFGYNKWRDSRQPTQLLLALCEEHGLDPPMYKLAEHRVVVDGHEFYGPSDYQDESGKLRASPERLALEALKSWQSMQGFGCALVPEHLETRPLFNE